MIATKILIIVLGIFLGGWGTRQLIKLCFNEMGGIAVLLLMVAGAVGGFFVANELALLLPQLPVQ